MIPSLKRPLTYILTAIFTFIGLAVSFFSNMITKANGMSPFPYYYILLIFVGVYLFFAYLFGDIVIITYRRKTPGLTDDLPLETNIKIWTIRWPFIFSVINIGDIVFKRRSV